LKQSHGHIFPQISYENPLLEYVLALTPVMSHK
jgi:hypothetical protein